jgi:hypothetical protein
MDREPIGTDRLPPLAIANAPTGQRVWTRSRAALPVYQKRGRADRCRWPTRCRYLDHAELVRREHAAMPGEDAVVAVD